MDLEKYISIVVHFSNDNNMKFKECKYGLYFFGTGKTDNTNKIHVTKYSAAQYILLNTVENKKIDIQLTRN